MRPNTTARPILIPLSAADADKVLLRWKLNDSQYRVIFGDLRIKDVTAAQLQELEAK